MPRHAPAAPTSPRAPTRARRRPEERPAQILDAALIEFGEKGLARTRLDDIAKRAGVAKGTIYLYFSTKDDLFRAMVRHTVGRTIDDVEAQASAGDGPAGRQLHAYVTSLWTYVRTPTFAVLHRLTTGELHEFPDLMRFFMQEIAARALMVCAHIIRRGVARGDFRAIDPDTAARMIHATVVKHGVWCAQRTAIPFVAHLSDADVLDDMLDFFDHALRPAPPHRARPVRPARARRRPSA